MTALGSALKRKFTKESVSFVSLNGINDLDFTWTDSYRVLDIVNITEAIIAYQPPLVLLTFSDGSEYLQTIASKYLSGLTNYLRTNKIPFVFAVTRPIFDNMIKVVIDSNGSVIELPFLVDSKAQKDQ